jgi:uncharacterized membrane protein
LSKAVAEAEAQPLAHAAARVRWWPPALGFIVVGVIYALISSELTLGPPWGLLVLALLAVAGARVTRWRGLMHARRFIVIISLTAFSVAVTLSAVYLVGALLYRSIEAITLLTSGALVWLSNLLTFSLWYWELDGGGPAHRHSTRCGSTDFAFPQTILADGGEVHWMPDYFDYVFLAFNTSTAFSPTDTMVLARRAKLLMMWQSIVSLTTIAVLVGRAINTL